MVPPNSISTVDTAIAPATAGEGWGPPRPTPSGRTTNTPGAGRWLRPL